MRFSITLLCFGLCAGLPLVAQTPGDLANSVQSRVPALTETYKALHRAPELSRHEEKTSAFFAGELRKLGYSVTERVGRYIDGTQAYGVVAVLENGKGPRLLLRTDMDALPVEEKTGADYASTVKTKDAQGQAVGVMHACGHDLHMTAMLGAAAELAARKAQWHGTLMIVGQPAEETGEGAAALLAGGIYERFGKPDYVVSEHDSNDVPAGSIAVKGGAVMAGSDSINVTIKGVGGHGSRPEAGKDPIVLAAEFVLAAQTIISRQTNPQMPAVLTIGTFHGGTKNNIIPDEAQLGISLRTYSSEQRDQIVAAIRRTAKGLAEAYGVPENRMPVVTLGTSLPPTINDAALAERIRASAAAALGSGRVEIENSIMASEDVGRFALEGKIPLVHFWLGAAKPEALAESRKNGTQLPSLHSALFAPDYERAIPTGVTALTAVALDLLK